MPYSTQLFALAERIKLKLQASSHRLVLAESCTGGLIASTLAQVPGVSEVLAGSLVVYQVESKRCWLNLDEKLLETHDVVSEAVSLAMAEGALQKTPHADLAISITGHLGPGAPAELDGTAWCGLSRRTEAGLQSEARLLRLLEADSVAEKSPQRITRQQLAALKALEWLEDAVDG